MNDDTAATVSVSASAPRESHTRAATIYDVARTAGVSHQTVSRYLKGFEGIRPATRERVISALAELDYRPNLTARSLRSGQSHRIAALTHEINQVGPSRIVQGASDAARQAGYILDIITLDMSDRSAVDEALDLVAQLDVIGVIALASTDEMAAAFDRADFTVPTVVAAEEDDAHTGHPNDLSVFGFPSLIAHLADLGHERFLHISGPLTWSAARNRRLAYETILAERGLTSVGCIEGDWSAKSGYEAIAAADPLGSATAVMASNDQMALGAMLALTERGVRIPEDVSVTGVDDIPEAAYFSPPLTTLKLDFESQGKSAVDQLLRRVDQARRHVGVADPSPPLHFSTLVVRRSSGPPPVEHP